MAKESRNLHTSVNQQHVTVPTPMPIADSQHACDPVMPFKRAAVSGELSACKQSEQRGYIRVSELRTPRRPTLRIEFESLQLTIQSPSSADPAAAAAAGASAAKVSEMPSPLHGHFRDCGRTSGDSGISGAATEPCLSCCVASSCRREWHGDCSNKSWRAVARRRRQHRRCNRQRRKFREAHR